jgi:hypothetical protein
MPTVRTYTPCRIQTEPGRYCHEPAHVVLFARTGEFAGATYGYGEKVLACLAHGEHILDARRAMTKWPGQPVAPWIANGYADRLPMPKLPDHQPPTETPRPKTTGVPGVNRPPRPRLRPREWERR